MSAVQPRTVIHSSGEELVDDLFTDRIAWPGYGGAQKCSDRGRLYTLLAELCDG
jgi:hypothetical protein